MDFRLDRQRGVCEGRGAEQPIEPAADQAVAAERRLKTYEDIPRAIEDGTGRVEPEQADVVFADGHAPAWPGDPPHLPKHALRVAAGINLIVAIAARQVDRSLGPIADDAASAADAPISVAAQAPVAFVLVASGVVGFAFFLMELVWYRMLGPLLGGSVFTFGLILAVALAGIGIGGLIYALVGADRPATIRSFAFTCLLEAVAIAFAFALGDRLATLAIVLTPFSLIGFWAQVGGWTVVTAIVVLPAALVAGYQFPLLVALLGRGRDGLGRQLGLTYATNTIGAIIGSLAGGFGLLPWLSAPGAWRLVAALLLVLGVAATLIRVNARALRTLVPQLALIAATVLLLTATGPTAAWRHSPIGAGRTPLASFTTPNQWTSWTRTRRRVVVWEGDGTESSVALTGDAAGYSFVVNGKSDGSAVGDAGTQVMLGMLGPILNPAARRTLVIGLGTGSSAGWAAAVPSMERVDVVELESLILDVARACTPVNQDVLNNPKIHLTIGDAREWLLLTPEHYDVIASEPSNPFRAGVASLFTREYYQAADARLNPDGLFLQWVQAYEVDARTIRTIYATMASVFPHVETWQTTAGDMVLVGGKHAIDYRSAVLGPRIAQEPFKTALRATWHTTSLTGLFAHYVGGDDLTRAIVSLPGLDRNDDDRNVVEFGFARAVGRTRAPMVMEIRDVARRLGIAEPVVDGVKLDWSTLRTALVSFYAATGFGASITADGTPAERARQEALAAFYVRSNAAEFRERWQSQTGGPRDPVELAMLAMFEATSGSDAARPYLDQIRSYEPAEADAILAMLLVRQGKSDEAATALESAFKQMATDPWPLQLVKEGAIQLAAQLGAQSPALARRMIAALATPFSAGALAEPRLTAAALLTRTAGLAETCAAPMHALEPYTPWDLGMLTLRRDCYFASGDPLLPSAERELASFGEREAQPFGIADSATAR